MHIDCSCLSWLLHTDECLCRLGPPEETEEIGINQGMHIILNYCEIQFDCGHGVAGGVVAG